MARVRAMTRLLTVGSGVAEKSDWSHCWMMMPVELLVSCTKAILQVTMAPSFIEMKTIPPQARISSLGQSSRDRILWLGHLQRCPMWQSKTTTRLESNRLKKSQQTNQTKREGERKWEESSFTIRMRT